MPLGDRFVMEPLRVDSSSNTPWALWVGTILLGSVFALGTLL
jgi:hypothetical protein